uniref:Zinc knuckle CX2CX4HX4C domain-containing protein n=1 Tax=Cajanus cajan TaxID=3821 RepID=A0A151RRK6_CAJCA|nr:hypothetical protein KK1_033333 [Cajanus cajan]
MNLNTLNMTRGRFARVCVEIDLQKLVLSRFNLNNVWYKVEYESLHLLCTMCGCYDHVVRMCMSPLTTMEKCAQDRELIAKGGGSSTLSGNGSADEKIKETVITRSWMSK